MYSLLVEYNTHTIKDGVSVYRLTMVTTDNSNFEEVLDEKFGKNSWYILNYEEVE